MHGHQKFAKFDRFRHILYSSGRVRKSKSEVGFCKTTSYIVDTDKRQNSKLVSIESKVSHYNQYNHCYHTNTKSVPKLLLSTSDTNYIIIGPTFVTSWLH